MHRKRMNDPIVIFTHPSQENAVSQVAAAQIEPWQVPKVWQTEAKKSSWVRQHQARVVSRPS